MTAWAVADPLNHPVDVNDADTVLAFVKTTMGSVAGWKSFEDNDNFFDMGMDSLQGSMAVRRFRQAFQLPTLALSTIYTHPSANQLTNAIIGLSKHHEYSSEAEAKKVLEERNVYLTKFQSEIDEMATSSQASLAVHKQKDQVELPQHQEHTVILTGSTGTLGPYILANLLSESFMQVCGSPITTSISPNTITFPQP